jgi:hypothetical protein
MLVSKANLDLITTREDYLVTQVTQQQLQQQIRILLILCSIFLIMISAACLRIVIPFLRPRPKLRLSVAK